MPSPGSLQQLGMADGKSVAMVLIWRLLDPRIWLQLSDTIGKIAVVLPLELS